MVPPALEEYIRQCRVVLDPEVYSVLRLSPDAAVKPDHAAQSLVWFRAPEDHTLVVPVATVRQWGTVAGLLERDDGWRRLTLSVTVPLTQPGFIRPFAEALAEAKISILPMSGYRHDHLLVHQVNLDRAVAVLERVRAAFGAAKVPT